MPQVDRGLEGVVVAETRLSHIDGAAGRLTYRGQDAIALAEIVPFEAVWHLLREGSLPDGAGLRDERARLAEAGRLSADERAAVARVGDGAEPLAALRSGISALAALHRTRPWLARDLDAVGGEAVGLAAAFPSVLAAVLGRGRDPGGASHAARALVAATGRPPTAGTERALDRYLTLVADHGMNASTFVARVVASTGADPGAALVAALGALSGPLHGGAPGPVLEMLDAIGRPERARDWIAARIRDGHLIMGFGHRVYRTDDPRAIALRRAARRSGGGRVELALAVEEAALEVLAERKPGRIIRTNVEFWTAVTLEACGVPRSLFTAMFATARAAGWTAHVLEQATDNRLIRPQAAYVGPPPPR